MTKSMHTPQNEQHEYRPCFWLCQLPNIWRSRLKWTTKKENTPLSSRHIFHKQNVRAYTSSMGKHFTASTQHRPNILLKNPLLICYFYRDVILSMLHISGALRCKEDGKGCLKGCVMEGKYDGVPDETMKFMMTVDREGRFPLNRRNIWWCA